MSEEKPRLARLTAIMTQLQSKKIVTARDIADKHGVSIRTVYRDIRTLEKSGIPIVTEEGKGYSILDGYKIPPVMFTEDEANALITAEQIISNNKDKSLVDQYHSAIEKIRAVLKFTQKGKAELLSDRLEIRANMANYQLIDINYLSLQDKASQRKIEPFALIHTQDNWVLIAYCRLRTEFRAFRLDCIQRAVTLETKFEPHKITLQQYFEEARKRWAAEEGS